MQVYATQFNADEVTEYLREMAANHELPVDLVRPAIGSFFGYGFIERKIKSRIYPKALRS